MSELPPRSPLRTVLAEEAAQGAAACAPSPAPAGATEPEPAQEPEWLDRPGLPFTARRRAVADLRRVNRLLLGRRASLAAALEELRGARGPQLLLDVAAGSGDVGAEIGRAAVRRGLEARVVALDRELSHLALGRRWGDVRLAVAARAEELPFRADTFSLALSSLFFHHLDRPGKLAVAREMLRVARGGAVIVDLVPSRWAVVVVRMLFPLLRVGRFAREDGLVSLRRGWPLGRWRALFAPGSGALPPGVEVKLRRRFPARLSVVLRRRAGSNRPENH